MESHCALLRKATTAIVTRLNPAAGTATASCIQECSGGAGSCGDSGCMPLPSTAAVSNSPQSCSSSAASVAVPLPPPRTPQHPQHHYQRYQRQRDSQHLCQQLCVCCAEALPCQLPYVRMQHDCQPCMCCVQRRGGGSPESFDSEYDVCEAVRPACHFVP
jgi:hypothetical protein